MLIKLYHCTYSYMISRDPPLAPSVLAHPSVSDSLGAKNTRRPLNLLQYIYFVDDEVLARITPHR